MAACMTSPSQNFDVYATSHQLHKHFSAGKFFDLAVYENSNSDRNHLHVYIGGDGKPWLKNRFKSIDPTSRRMTTLALMALDKRSAIYLGRPCYHNMAASRGCSDKWWTSHRYSKKIVDDMSYVLDKYIVEHNTQSITLFGFSGGGTIAMLLAPLIKQTVSVVTINGNLDTDEWVKLHNYTPLFGSLNPALQTKLSKNIRQIHLVGLQDRNIPVDVIINQFAGQKNTEIISYPEFTHHCCWQDIWPEFLQKM